ncbi:hypothetical protein JTB14_020340 [Gonioctena quinquepunctata]|nr:hypothetical protein JTB14_020340 [Gonioctena quinquepunctata]
MMPLLCSQDLISSCSHAGEALQGEIGDEGRLALVLWKGPGGGFVEGVLGYFVDYEAHFPEERAVSGS